MIGLVVLMIVGIVFLAARIIACRRRGGVYDYWLNLIERCEQAWPGIELGDGNDSE